MKSMYITTLDKAEIKRSLNRAKDTFFIRWSLGCSRFTIRRKRDYMMRWNRLPIMIRVRGNIKRKDDKYIVELKVLHAVGVLDLMLFAVVTFLLLCFASYKKSGTLVSLEPLLPAFVLAIVISVAVLEICTKMTTIGEELLADTIEIIEEMLMLEPLQESKSVGDIW